MEERLEYVTGQAIFEKIWVSSPSSTTASDGLGPLYNARSCAHCHEDGGRGNVDNSLVLHVNDAIYGQQIQTFAIAGLPAEARVSIQYTQTNISFPDGETISLSAPVYSVIELQQGPMSASEFSPRIASSLAGLGLIEKIPEAMIQALADEHDSNDDGISGRINRVWDSAQQVQSMGRFGWKAGQATLPQQSARALNIDLGISSPLYMNPYGDCTDFQTSCLQRAHGNTERHDNLEASQVMMDSLMFFIRNIPPPKPVELSRAGARNGAEIFRSAACDACHQPGFDLEEGRIEPYSDFLLHDMGEGLSDKLEEGMTSGGEWRTAPLWGIGSVNTEFLHDGRAKTLQEAILWHDGEGRLSRDRYTSMIKSDRDDLIRFLNAL